MKGHAFTDAQTTEYEKRVREAWLKTGFPCLEADAVAVIINAYFSVPASWSKKKRAAAFDTPYLHKPDCDNIAKIILDSLNGGLGYADDRQVNCLLVNKKYVASDADLPRVEVTIIGETQ